MAKEKSGTKTFEEELKLEFKVEDLLTTALKEFGPISISLKAAIKNKLYYSLLRLVVKETKILKSEAVFTDRTGRLRRSLFVEATFRPLAIIAGSYHPYFKYVAYAHGTWPGGWWEDYKKKAKPRITKAIDKAIKRIIGLYRKDLEKLKKRK